MATTQLNQMLTMTATAGNTTDPSPAPDLGKPLSVLLTEYLYMSIGLLGMVGNLFVLIVIFSVPTMRKKLTNIYIINQSVVDFWVSFFLLTTARATYEMPNDGVWYQIYCKVWSCKLPLWGFMISSTYNLVALTLERYFEVVHPIWHKVTFNHRKAYISVALVWLIGPVFNAAYMIPSSVIVDNVCLVYASWPTEGIRRGFGVFTGLLQYLFPLLVLIYAYGRIVIRLTSKVSVPVSDNKGNAPATTTNQPPKDDHYQRARRNTIKTLLLVAFGFVMCWSWNQIYYFLMNVNLIANDFSSPFYHFTVDMVFVNCCINPFVYSLNYKPFQAGAKALFCKRCAEKRVGDSGSSAASTTNAGE